MKINTEVSPKIPMECKVLGIQSLMGKKWTIRVLDELNEKKVLSYNRLESSIKGITAKLLVKRLNELKDGGIIERKIVNNKPLKVEYRLTKMGKDLLLVVKKLKDWGIEYNLVPKNCSKNNCNACLNEKR
jgi:DNA-binding HxlR family transcriptional regulator